MVQIYLYNVSQLHNMPENVYGPNGNDKHKNKKK